MNNNFEQQQVNDGIYPTMSSIPTPAIYNDLNFSTNLINNEKNSNISHLVSLSSSSSSSQSISPMILMQFIGIKGFGKFELFTCIFIEIDSYLLKDK